VPGVEVLVIRNAFHVVEFLILFVLWWRIFRSIAAPAARFSVWLAFFATLVYASFDEVHQHVVGRDGNIGDVLIDSGIPCFVWLRTEARRRKVLRPQARVESALDQW
jgi:VanZ family protein